MRVPASPERQAIRATLGNAPDSGDVLLSVQRQEWDSGAAQAILPPGISPVAVSGRRGARASSPDPCHASAMLRLRDAGDPLPAAGVLVSPWLDLTLSDPMCSKEELRRAADLYVASQDPVAPYPSPLRADLHGLPPLLVPVGGDEVLLSDATRLAQAEGVTLEVWEGLWA